MPGSTTRSIVPRAARRTSVAVALLSLSLLALPALALGCDGPAPSGDAGPLARDDGGTPGDAGPPPPVVPDADPDFGAGGLALVNVAHEWIGFVWSIVIQPDGRILAGGRTSDAFVVLRALPDGTLDPSFGTGGLASVPVGSAILTPTTVSGLGAIALAPDGSIVVATVLVEIDTAVQRELVARLTPDGALDASFGTRGYVVGDYTVPEGALANAVAVQPDGRIVVASRDHVDRLLPDGTPDPSFGSGGRFASMLGGVFADYQAVALDGSGRVVLSGVQGAVDVGRRVFVARLTSTGALDPSFAGGAGHVLDTAADAGFTAQTRARSVAIDSAGRVVVGAMRTMGRAWLSVGRFTADGALDASFGDGGWASTVDGVSYGGTTAVVAVQGDDRVVAMGGSGIGGEPAQLVRWSEDGSLDTTFGEGGAGAFARYDGSLGLALGAGDALVLAGFTSGVATTYLRRLSRDGAEDASFAGDGALETPTNAGYDRALSALVLPDGRILLGGTGTALNVGALARLTPEGRLDPTFATAGRMPRAGFDAVTSMALDASGRALVCGPGASTLRARRLLDDGSVDPAYGDGGALSMGTSTRSANMAVGTDGRVYVAGYSRAGLSGGFLGVKRLLADGTADPSYGAGGEAIVPIASRGTHAVLAVQSDGAVVVSGDVLVRFDPSGAPDASFGTGGIASGGSNAHAIALADDGAVVLAWRRSGGGSGAQLEVQRRLADGTPDPGFGEGGTAWVDLGRSGPAIAGVTLPLGLALEDDGGLLVATTGGDAEGLREHAMLVRLTAAGALDASYGARGRRALVLGRGSSALHAMVADDATGTLLLVGRALGDETGTSELMALRLLR